MFIVLSEKSRSGPIGRYLSLARIDHWIKNVFVLPGVFVAYLIDDSEATFTFSTALDLAIAVCFAASANYTINEYLDRESDRHHPVKSKRASVQFDLNPAIVFAQYVSLAMVSIFFAYLLGPITLVSTVTLLTMGILYNVKPVRLKDLAFFDVISESFNNPIRVILGWSAATTIILPPLSILLSFWFGGAFLMAAKRFAEYRAISDKKLLVKYRKSFAGYTELTLLISCVFYSLSACFLLGAGVVKYRVELILIFPFVAVLFCWYMVLAFNRENSQSITVEELHSHPKFLVYNGVFVVLILFLLIVDIPALDFLVNHFVSDDWRIQK